MPSVTDYHELIRDSIVNVIEDANFNAPIKAVDEPESDAALADLPVILVACVGPEQERSEWHTNLSDGIGYSVAVLFMGHGTTSGEKSASLSSLTEFRRRIHVLFHMKRLSGVAQVGWCEVSDSGPIFDRDSPAYLKLQSGLVITAVGRFHRS